MRMNSDEYEQLAQIRRLLHAHMYKFFNCSVVWSNHTQKTPPKPYVTILPTSKVFINQNHYDEQVRYERYQVRQFHQTLSVNIYGKNDEVNMHAEPRRLANEIRRWFQIHGKYELEKLDVAVVNIGDTTDRTTYVVDSYDYKVGMDIVLRMVQTDSYIKYVQGEETEENYDIIETVIVTDEGNDRTVTINKK